MTTCQTCPLCGAAETTLYLDDKEEVLDLSVLGSSRQSVSHGRILRCRRCRLGFRQQRSSNTELEVLYRRMDTEVYESEERGRAKTAARHFRIVQRYANPGRILDVGCASGLFLRCAAQAGWEVFGVEPSETLSCKARAAINGRGEVFCTTLEGADFGPGSFHAVTLWDVLEHVPHPLGLFRKCVCLLKPGGTLYVNVPDLDSFEALVLGSHWPLLLPEHLNYFNRRSLRLCGERLGLTELQFGRRPASFSLKYVLARLAQHRFPGASACCRLAGGNFLGTICLPVFLGEIYGVWKR